MQEMICNLEEISALLDSVANNVFILHEQMEPGRKNIGKAHSALYGVWVQLEEIAKALQVCVEALEFGENQA